MADYTNKIISISRKPEVKSTTELCRQRVDNLKTDLTNSIDTLMEQETEVDSEVLKIMKMLTQSVRTKNKLEEYKP